MSQFESVWIVDDDNIHQFFATKSLNHLKITDHILPFLDGDSALNTMQKIIIDKAELPDVIFLDINMPKMDGWEFMDEFSKIAGGITKKILIFIVSSSIADADRDRAKSYPYVTDFLIKPILPDTLKMAFGL
jgi:CheY-like chemotaxis protein